VSSPTIRSHSCRAGAPSQKLGPEYVALMVGLEEIDAESKDGQEIGSTLVALDKLCAN